MDQGDVSRQVRSEELIEQPGCLVVASKHAQVKRPRNRGRFLISENIDTN